MSAGFFDAAVEGVDAIGGGGADFVIVGSGAGGGAAARVLAASGRSVLVLEEGPLIDHDKLGIVAQSSLVKHFRNAGQSAAFGRAAMPFLQGSCVGGTTFVNSAIIWRLPEKVLKRWHTDFGLKDALTESALDEAYATLEDEMSVREVGPAIASLSDARMELGAQRAGIEARHIHRNESGCKGSGRCFHGCPNNAKQSTTINYLKRATSDGGRVLAHARVDRVIISGGRAVAVVGTIVGTGPHAGKKFRVQARKGVIVSASVIQSPNLLRRSKAGRGGDALGNHFTAHPGMSVVGVYPEPIHMWTGASQGFEAFGLRDTLGVKFETLNVPPEITASRLPGAGARWGAWIEKLPYLAGWAVALRADTEGSVRPSVLFGGDVVYYSMIKSDLERMRNAVRRIAEMHFLAGATEVLPGVSSLPETIKADQLDLIDQAPLDARAFGGIVATHLFGTCRSGPDPRTSVVDPHLRVHGVEGLHVMDASVFPTNTGVNPQHSIMAIATVAAKRLAAA